MRYLEVNKNIVMYDGNFRRLKYIRKDRAKVFKGFKTKSKE